MPVHDPTKCPVCDRSADHTTVSSNRDLIQYDCPRCGNFIMAWGHAHQLQIGIDLPCEDAKDKLSILLRERTVHRLQPYLLVLDDAHNITVPGATPISIKELLTNWPKTTTERLQRALVNLKEESPTIGSIVSIRNYDEPVVFAMDKEEASLLVMAMKAQGLVLISYENEDIDLTLTVEGWQQVDELTRFKSSPEHPVFVAMWFGKSEAESREMFDVYEKGISPGVRVAGYRVDRVDQVEYNDDIMDKVMGMIRVAPFLVADYTGNRNGVYYEAGFAKGLGLPVINCCKEEDFPKTHFDIKQLNHILWKSPEDLRERLKHRILSSIGEGPYKPENARPDE